MTTIVDVLKRAARQCSVDEPSSWISTVGEEQVELRDDFLRETVEDIAQKVDCVAPVGAKYDLAGDGSESYDLPSQFFRLHRDDLAVYDSSLDRAVCADREARQLHLPEGHREPRRGALLPARGLRGELVDPLRRPA